MFGKIQHILASPTIPRKCNPIIFAGSGWVAAQVRAYFQTSLDLASWNMECREVEKCEEDLKILKTVMGDHGSAVWHDDA